MNLSHLQRHSLKTRVTLLALSIFVINIWLLSFYTTRMLRNDLERHLSEQQFSTVSFMARDINQELDLRLRALETIAAKVSPLMSGNAAALQQYLEGLPLLTFLFNSGMLVVGPDGTTIADVPRSAGRLGVNYMNRDFVVAALKEGKTTISQPVMGKVLKAPLIGMVVPIRDGRGKVIGALDGVSALGESSFLDKVTNSSYGKTGSYLLVARQSRMIVTAGEKNLIMTPLLGVGVIPLIDRFVDGYEGSGILVNRLGEERLSSTKGIPLAGWYVTASLPTAEAFAPVREMQQRVLLATIFLTILAAGLTWWMLRRELGPMLAAVKALTAMSQSTERQTPLPVAKQDQVGLLIEGFNHLLTTVWHGDAKLQESESRFRMMADTAPVLIWISGDDKLCHWFNQGWLDFTGRSMEQERGNGWAEGVHPEDFDRCLEFYVSHFEQRKEFRMDYRLRRHDGEYRWVDDHGVPRFGIDGMFEGYIGCCIDIHESRQANAERARLLRIIEEAPDFIATSDMQAHLKYLNNAGARLVGLPEGVDLTHLEIKDMHPAWGAKLVLEEGIAAVLEKGFWQHENALLHRTATRFPFRNCCWSIATPPGTRRCSRPSCATSPRASASRRI